MIVRIVKMTFVPGKTEAFLEVFDTYREHIRKQQGCIHLDLLRDIKSPNVFFTYSHWENEDDLNNYRDSELFATVWGKTKLLFEIKAEAWSLNKQ